MQDRGYRTPRPSAFSQSIGLFTDYNSLSAISEAATVQSLGKMWLLSVDADTVPLKGPLKYLLLLRLKDCTAFVHSVH